MRAEAEINFECSGCGQPLSVDGRGAGQTTSCPSCQQSLTIPKDDVVGRIAAITNLVGDGWNEVVEPSTGRGSETSGAEISTIREQLIDAVRTRARLERDLAAVRVEMESLQVQLRRSWDERDQLISKVEQLQSSRVELENEHAELLSECGALRESIIEKDAEITTHAESIRELQEKQQATEVDRVALADELIPLRAEVAQLRDRASLVQSLERENAALGKDIASSREAKEFHALRLRAETAEGASKEQQVELEKLRAEMARLSKSDEALRVELAAINERFAAEERKVQALADGKVQRDNEVLRAVLGRQKSELENCYRELKRFRRAQLGIRLVYALFALGLLGVAAFAVQVLPEVTEFIDSLVE